MQPRIEWSDDGMQLLSCANGVLRRHDLEGGSIIVDEPALCDARWDGTTIVGVDRDGIVREYTAGGEVVTHDAGGSAELAAIARTARRYATVTTTDGLGIALFDFSGKRSWQLRWWEVGLDLELVTSVAISDDARHLAIGHEKRGTANFAGEHTAGRGWVVIDLQKDRIVDRAWLRVTRAARPMRLAFDRAGRRLAMAVPERATGWSPIRIGCDERYPRESPGEALAVALDDRGILAAYAHPGHRLRVDYLEAGARGPAALAILDTLTIESANDLVALAFDRKSRRIAGLDAAGQVEILPVP